MKPINIPFSLQIQKVHFWLNTFKKLDLFRFVEQMEELAFVILRIFYYKQC